MSDLIEREAAIEALTNIGRSEVRCVGGTYDYAEYQFVYSSEIIDILRALPASPRDTEKIVEAAKEMRKRLCCWTSDEVIDVYELARNDDCMACRSARAFDAAIAEGGKR